MGLLAVFLLAQCIRIVVKGAQPQASYDDPQVAQDVVRGTIYDRNGKILAMETPTWACVFFLREIPDIVLASELAAPYVGMTPLQIQKLCEGRTNYVMVNRKIEEEDALKLQEAASRAHLSNGVVVEKGSGRTYPASFHASHIVGFTNLDGTGVEGIELSQDKVLQPRPQMGVETTYGSDVYLTLDVDIQYLLDLQVQQIVNEHDPDYVMAIVMDANNGDILAATSSPWYDPNFYSNSSEEQRQNRNLSYMYEPGSVFKLFSLAAVMQAGQADFDEPFFCDGTYSFTLPSKQVVTINCTAKHGYVDQEGMIKHSCNGAIVHWAMQTDDDTFRTLLSQMHFGRKWDLQLPGIISGSLAQVPSWSGRTKATLSFGQELGVNALQMATAATILTNGGSLLQPNIISKVVDPSGATTLQRQRTVVQQVLDPAIAQEILTFMEAATQTGGTATKAAVEGIRVGAKTGTAQILNAETNSYTNGSVLASTIAIVPVDAPKYIIYMAAAHPKGNTIWGSNIAAPAIGQVIEGLASQGKLTSDKARTI